MINNVPPRIEAPLEETLREMIGPPNIQLAVSPYCGRKEVFERLVAALLLIPALPVIAVAMLGIVMTSPGWPIFCQIRVGKNCRYFRIFKLRTMRPNAESSTGPVFSSQGDNRTTWLGKWLRKLHIDELPQLINVVRGDMGLIGPRPERPEFVAVLSKGIPHYADRLTVLPGITGLAAINLPPDTGLESAKRKQILDVEYIETANLWLDLKMLACTALRIIGLSGDRTIALTGVYREVPGEVATEVSAPTSIMDVEAEVTDVTDEDSQVLVKRESSLMKSKRRMERKENVHR